MSEQPVIVQKISWSDLCPWTLIFKTLPVSYSATAMVFATLGVVLTPIGWLLSETIFINQELRSERPQLVQIAEVQRSPYRGVFLATDQKSDASRCWARVLVVPEWFFGNS